MVHPLVQELTRFRRRARHLIIAAATARAIALLVAVAMALALLDALVHFQDRGLRAIGLLATLAAFATGLRWVIRSARQSRFELVQIALQVESAFPQLRGRVASAVEFLAEPENNPLAGSADLRRASVRAATTDIGRFSLDAALDSRPARRAAVVAGATVTCAALLAIISPSSARIAVLRLANPLSDVRWPRINQLAIRQPVERLPRGQTFEVEVVDSASASLPDDCFVEYRIPNADGSVSEESEPIRSIGGTLLARRESVQHPFDYRVVGGDDHFMPWHHLDLVEPPAIVGPRLTLHYPAYTGWPAQSSEPNVRVLVGTQIEIQGRATTPLSSAQVRAGTDEEVPGQLSSDGLQVSVPATPERPWIVKNSTTYWFELIDRDGFGSGAEPKYELRATPDAAPTVAIEHPQGNIFVTAMAVLPVAVSARDDLALADIKLDYLRSDHSDQGTEQIALVTGPQQVSAEQAAASAAENYDGDRRVVNFDWNLATLELPPGAQLTFHAVALDYAGQTAQSLPRRLTIVTSAEIQDRLTDRQALIFNELSRVLELQQAARSHVAGLESQLRTTGSLRAADIDLLQGASLNQQQVERELTAEAGGLRGQIADFLDELAINRIDGADSLRQMQGLLGEISRLADGPLPQAGRNLTAGIKAAQVGLQEGAVPPAAKDETRAALAMAGTAQDKISRSLEQMIDELKQWVNYRHFHRELGQLSKAQQEIGEQTATIGQQTLTRAYEALDSQQRADLEKLSQRQLELARRLDRLEQRLADSAAGAPEEDPLATDAMNDALEHARQRGIANTMRESGKSIDRNKIGHAAQQQQGIVEDLQELQDILAGRREHGLERLVKKLREAESRLAELKSKQDGLLKKLRTAENLDAAQHKEQLERLHKEQRELQSEAQRLARNLERLQARPASSSTAAASGKMQQAAEAAKSNDSSSAADEAKRALDDLDAAEQQLAEQRRQAEADLAQEQLGRMEDAVASLHERQENLVSETEHYQRQQADRGHLTRAEAATVRDLARQQLGLAEEAREMAKSLSGASVFQFVLQEAGEDMNRAGAGIDQRNLEQSTLAAQRQALARIGQLQAALEAEQNPQQPEGGEQTGGDQPGSEPGGEKTGGQPKVRSVAELKLLKLIQEQINERTAALDQSRQRSAELTGEQQAELAALSKEQGRLADLVANIMQADAESPEENPDELPDIHQKTNARQPDSLEGEQQ